MPRSSEFHSKNLCRDNQTERTKPQQLSVRRNTEKKKTHETNESSRPQR